MTSNLSSPSTESEVTIVFGIAATVIGLITVLRSSRFWSFWYKCRRRDEQGQHRIESYWLATQLTNTRDFQTSSLAHRPPQNADPSGCPLSPIRPRSLQTQQRWKKLAKTWERSASQVYQQTYRKTFHQRRKDQETIAVFILGEAFHQRSVQSVNATPQKRRQ